MNISAIRSRYGISSGQFAILVFFVGVAVKMFMLPSLLLKVSGRDGVFVMVFYLVVELINTVIFLIISKRNGDKTYFQILIDGFGKPIAVFFVIYFSVYLFFKLVLLIGEIKIFFSISIYERIYWPIMILPLFALCVNFAIKPLRNLARCGELFMPFVVVSAVVLSYLLLGKVPFSNVLPFFDKGINDVVKGIDTFPIWFSDTASLIICLGNIKDDKKLVTFSLISRGVAMMSVLLFSTVMFSTYANLTDLVDYGRNVSSMTEYSLSTESFGRIDYLIYCQWILAVIIKTCLLYFTLVKNAEFVVYSALRKYQKDVDFLFCDKPEKICDNFENNFKNKGTYPRFLSKTSDKNSKTRKLIINLAVALALYVVSTFILNSEENLFEYFTGNLKYFLIPIEFFLPVILLVVCLLKFKKAEAVSESVQNNEGRAL